MAKDIVSLPRRGLFTKADDALKVELVVPAGKLLVAHGAPKTEAFNWRTGRPLASQAHLTNEAVKPWVALGMSRRTWYRRKAKK